MSELTPFRRNRMLPGSWFRDFFTDDFFSSHLSAIKADIFTEGDNLVIEAELPGFTKDEIKVRVNDEQLTISAQRKVSNEEKAENYIRRERSVQHVCRTFTIDNLYADKIQAEFQNGLLRLKVPNPKELQSKVKEIDIN